MDVFKKVAVILVSFVIVACSSSYTPDITRTSSLKGTDVYQPDSLSIAAHYKIPQWFTDAKLGIFIHWGVYSVPGHTTEWYARVMYDPNSDVYKSHVKTYGPVDQFGYKDLIPLFKGENFNAKDWVSLFKESGARYIVPVAEHHDGFAMYNSTFNHWNSVEMGPKRDIIGELALEARKQNIYFGLSSHRAENAWFYNLGMNIPSDVQDTSITMYGERLLPPSDLGISIETGENEGSNARSRQQWKMHMYELIDLYHPDLIWFDWTVGKKPFQPVFYDFLAYYYNSAIDWNKEVVVNTKVGYGDAIQVFDIERGKSDRIRRYPWQTDTSIGKLSWGYNKNEINKSPDHIIDDFVDIVSKNGNLLLNVGPKPDGTITEEQAHVLNELGGWLKCNGEGIYASRPWVISGEGQKGTAGYMTDGESTSYTSKDIRFTTNNEKLFAFILGHTSDTIRIASLNPLTFEGLKIRDVSMLGSSEKLIWSLTDKDLCVVLPKSLPVNYVQTLKIDLDGIAYGQLERETVGDKLKVSIRVFNHSEATQQKLMTCKIGKVEQTQNVVLPAHECTIVDFLFDVEQEDLDNINFICDGITRSESICNEEKNL